MQLPHFNSSGKSDLLPGIAENRHDFCSVRGEQDVKIQKSSVFVAICLMATASSAALAESFKAVCTVTAGSVSRNKFATLKCYKDSEPGHYRIRSTKWERDGKKAYRDLVRLSGRRFTCTMTSSGSSISGDTLLTNYKISNCH